MPRKKRRGKARRPGLDSEMVCWLLDEPFHYDNWYAEHFGTLTSLNCDMSPGMYRGFAGMSNHRSPITPEDVKYLPHWSKTLNALRDLRKVYDDLPEDVQAEVPEDRKALIMAVDENIGTPDVWHERRQQEQAEIDKITGRKEGQLLSVRTGRPYYVEDLEIAGELRVAAKKREGNLRAIFDNTPEHIRIQVPEAWAVLDIESSEDLWDKLLSHYAELDLDRPFTLSYRSDAVEHTIGAWSEMEDDERRAAVEREREPIRVI